MMVHGGGGGSSSKAYAKMAASDPAVESALSNANFNDFDDDSSNYYIRKVSHPMSAGKRKMQAHYAAPAFAYGPADEFGKRSDGGAQSDSGEQASQQVDEKESVDAEMDKSAHSRVKRQVYMSSHEEGPCHGFPLEINVKSRVKLDQIFPIHGKSQFKKCIKVG